MQLTLEDRFPGKSGLYTVTPKHRFIKDVGELRERSTFSIL